MLTVELAGIVRRGTRLYVRPLPRATRELAVSLAEGYVSTIRSSVDRSRHEIDEALSAFEVDPRERKLADGLRKLLLDACEFEMGAVADPAQLRQIVFLAASRERRVSGRIDREAVLAQAASQLELLVPQAEALLFADLRDAHRLRVPALVTPTGLVEQYERGRAQAVLLRATRVQVALGSSEPAALRALFGRLKFLRLLHRIRAVDGGYHITIDGPLSLFGSVTKYGLSMAMLLSVLAGCGQWRLRAEVLWGKERLPCTFELESQDDSLIAAAPPLSDELQRFVERFTEQFPQYEVAASHAILEVRGEGMSVPDLVFVQRRTGDRVYFEVMGYWSREAVFRQVDLVERGLRHKVIFAVSERLRVSQEVLPADLPAALYVYKGVMSPAKVAGLLERLCAASAPAAPS